MEFPEEPVDGMDCPTDGTEARAGSPVYTEALPNTHSVSAAIVVNGWVAVTADSRTKAPSTADGTLLAARPTAS